jgi:TRAP-type mannitol/chloroaromatic compound transport system substrate-binding protein
MGAAVVSLPGAEIVPALERGVIDAAEWSNPSSDRGAGFSDVARNYMLQSYHQHTEAFEVLFNRQRFEGLPEELQHVIRHAAEAASSDMSWKQQDRFSRDLAAMAQAGVTVRQTPRPILDAQLQAWDRVIARMEGDASSPAAGPFFKRVCDSQREWCRRVAGFYLRYQASPVVAFNHFFARQG